jgi:AraC-like DNA-binding protein
VSEALRCANEVPAALYSTHSPRKELRPFVRRLFAADTPIARALRIRPGPTGYNYLGWYCAGRARIVVDGATRIQTGLHFSGQIQGQEIEVAYERTHVTHILAEFTATGLTRLTHVLGKRIRGATVPVAEAAPELAEFLSTRLQSCGPSLRARRDAFQRVLGELAESAAPPIDYLDEAVRLIEAAGGQISVAKLARRLGISPRQLQRRFSDVVGVGPKYFAKVIQLNTALGALLSNDETYLVALCHDCGYYDQAHFAHVMQEFFRQGPGDFLRSKHDVLATFLGRRR